MTSSQSSRNRDLSDTTDDDDNDPMEGVESSLVQQRPRRANAIKDYKAQKNCADDEELDEDADNSNNNNNSNSPSGTDDDDDDEDASLPAEEDEEKMEDDNDSDTVTEQSRRRSGRRRTPVVPLVVAASTTNNNKKRGSSARVRTSSRSTKFTNSMAEPTGNRDLLMPASPHKTQARRHQQQRRSLTTDQKGTETASTSSSSSESETEESEEEEEEEEEPLKVQRVLASRTEPLQKWKEIGAKMNTTEVTYGSRWFQDADDNDPTRSGDPNAFQERFLVKWSDLSFLHVSWETETDLVEQADAKTYLTNFFRKSVGGLLYSQDERCDGDYFDPAFTQVERILEVQLPEGWDDGDPPRKDGDTYAYGMIMDRADPQFDEGTGRQFLVKWGNLPYTECTYEFERDLVLNDIEYVQQLNEFLERNKKPTKSERRAYLKAGDDEIKRLYPIFGDKTLAKDKQLSKEEKEAAVDRYKTELQQQIYKNGGQLRDYQAEGVAWMVANYLNNRSCILSDEMGLGKTLQTASLSNILANKLNRDGPVLIVAPLSTLSHWYREFTRWTDLNTIIYHGSSDDRKLIREHEFVYECDRPSEPLGFRQLYLKKCIKSKSNKLESPWMIDVVITTPEMMVCDDAIELSFVEWKLLVVDEAHRLKNHSSKLATLLRDEKFTFRHRMLLTGTPIQNEIMEFYTLLNFVDKSTFGDSEKFMARYGDMKSKERVDELHNMIRPYILRRLKEDVEHSVPPKEETLIEVELTIAQKQYYRALYEKNVKFLHKNKKKALDGPSLNNLAMQLRKCCNHLFLLKGIEAEFRAKETALSEGDFLTKASGKLVLLDKLLPRLKDQGHRVLIFSQFKIMLDILEDYLNARQMKFERIDGSITGNKRQQAIDRFQSPATAEKEAPFIMMLSTRAGGVGINLTAADTCIIFDSDWNPQNDLQAQARCHRIGQTKNVKVYRLLTKKTYEMQMFHMASLKMGLDQAVLNGFESGSSGEGTLSKEEVENLLRHGAYDIFNEEKAGDGEAASNAFVEQDIDSILERHSRTVIHENSGSTGKAAGSTFSKATFSATTPGTNGEVEEVDIEDPDFWKKIVGEGTANDADDMIVSGRRKRAQANYSEHAYNLLLNEQILVSGDDGGASDSDDDDLDDNASHERARWGGTAPNEWKKDDVESLIRSLSTFGYGIVSWEDLFPRLQLSKDYPISEIKRMAWSLVMFTIMDAAVDDAEKALNREVKAAEKDREKNSEAAKAADGGVLAATLPPDGSEKPLSSIETLKQAAFEKLRKETSPWMKAVIADAVAFAKENSPRDQSILTRVLRRSTESATSVKKSHIATMFATSVWPSLKSRGWKAEVSSDGSSAGKTRYSYDGKDYFSTDSVLKAAQPLYPELQNAIETIISSADENRRAIDKKEAEQREEDLALCLDNADPATLQNFLEKYGSMQLVVDQTKSPVARIRLSRKIISTSNLMHNAVAIVRRSAKRAVESGESSVDRLAKTLVTDKKTALPHPLWTSHHDAVLIHAIAKHGWIDTDASVRAISDDNSIKWGPPFDTGDQGSAMSKPAFDNTGQIVSTAYRAAAFFYRNAELIKSLKHFNQNHIARSYSLKRMEGNDSALLDTEEAWIVDQDALSVPRCATAESTKQDEQVELPPKKDLVKRIKSILSKPLSVICPEKPVASGKPSHGYTVLDQSDGANLFLAELLRAILKEPGQSKLPKKLLIAAIEEARHRADALSSEAHLTGVNGSLRKQAEEFDRIAEHIEDAKRYVAKSAMQYKNVIRVILGEEPLKPRKDSEITELFPPRVAKPQALKTKIAKFSNKPVTKVPSKSTGEKAIASARKRLEDHFGGDKKTPRSDASLLELTEIETHILTASCAIGIPVWTEDTTLILASGAASGGWRLTWETFGEYIVKLAVKAFERAHADLLKAKEDHQLVFETTTIESNVEDLRKRSVVESKYEAAQRFYTERGDVLNQAMDYQREPPVLAKKSVMLLAKITGNMPPSSNSSFAEKSDDGLGSKVIAWFGAQLVHWAASLELLDNYGMPLAFTAVEFLNDLPEHDRSSIEIASIFEKRGCRMVAAQIALISRLRSLYVTYEGDSILSQKVEKAGRSVRASGDKWDHRPKGWTPQNDSLLIQRLVHCGLTGNVMDGVFADASFHLSRGCVQQRANQLARELHADEEKIEAFCRVLEERRNSPLPAGKPTASSKPPPQQHTSEHRVEGTDGDSGSNGNAKPVSVIDASLVIDLVGTSDEDMNDDDVCEILGKAPTAEKRMSSDSADSCSDKKPRIT